MTTLQDVVDQIQSFVRPLDGIRNAPNVLPNKIAVFPTAICYFSDGDWHSGPIEAMTGLHNVVVEVHLANKDMSDSIDKAMPYGLLVPQAVMSAFRNGNLTTIQTFSRIRYTFGPLVWDDPYNPNIGWRFTFMDCKLQVTL